jgi:hypothetical protein
MPLTLHGGASPKPHGCSGDRRQASRLLSCVFPGCCFAPDGGAPAHWMVPPAPGELGSDKRNAGARAAHPVQSTVLLFPVGTTYHGTPQTLFSW